MGGYDRLVPKTTRLAALRLDHGAAGSPILLYQGGEATTDSMRFRGNGVPPRNGFGIVLR